MTAAQKSMFQKVLEEMKARLEPGVAGLAKEAFRPTAAASSLGEDTQSDPGTSSAQEEVARTLFGAESGTLAEINDALQRLHLGRYGTCEACGGVITLARLKALPYARNCQKCAQGIEKSAR
jgi:DnaK suppressor protein